MSYLQFLLVVHVLGAVIGFGSTFAFAFFPADADALEPGVRTTLADISYKVGTRLSDPVVFLIQPLTGVLMIFETGRNHGFSTTSGSGSRSPCTWCSCRSSSSSLGRTPATSTR